MTFNSTGLALGTYTGNLCVESNDPDAGPGNGTELVVVPLRLVVEGQPPNIDVDPLSMSATQPANTSTQQTAERGQHRRRHAELDDRRRGHHVLPDYRARSPGRAAGG